MFKTILQIITSTCATLSMLLVSQNLLAEIPISKAPKDAKVYFITPKDGETLTSPVKVVFGLSENMGVAPAGVNTPHTGHHHLIINGSLPPKGKPIPSDKTYRHFGKGQTETVVDLAKGKHTLQLILGNHIHVPHEPMVYSKKITITVK